MILFSLQDVNEAALHREGANLGIPGASTLTKDPLMEEIKKKLSPNGSLVLAPLKWSREPTSARGILISTVVATASAIGALITALLTYSIAISTTEAAKASSGLYEAEMVKMREATEKDVAERNEKKKEAWKRVVIHKIIDDGMKKDGEYQGLTIDEIRIRYGTEVARVTEVSLNKDDMSDLSIRKVLLDLNEKQLVYPTLEDRYATQKYGLATKDELRRNVSNTQIAYAVLNVLAKESEAGKYTMPEMIQLMMEKVKGSTHEEVNAVLTEFVAKKYIIVGEDRKLWSAAHPPKKKGP